MIHTPVSSKSTTAQSNTGQNVACTIDRLISRSQPGNTTAKYKDVSPLARVMDKTVTITRRCDSETEQEPSPAASVDKSRQANILAMARALVVKAKTAIGTSRNTKTEIKNDILECIDGLYNLVKKLHNNTPEMDKPKEDSTGMTTTSNLDQTELMKKLEENSKLLADTNLEIQKLHKTLAARNSDVEKVSVTYADTARKNALPRTLHSVAVTSEDDMDTGEEVLEKIRKTMDAKEGWVKVERVRKAKDRRVIIGCATTTERDKVKDRIMKAGIGIVAENIINKDPLVVFKNVLNYNTNEAISKALENQNASFYEGLREEERRMEIRYRRRARNPLQSHVVARVSPKLWGRMVNAGAAYIDLQKVTVEDQSPLVQCSLCLGYGHTKKYCTESKEKCSHCAGEHMKSDCPKHAEGSPPQCCNCIEAGSNDLRHSAFSDECPIRKKWDTLARTTIAYC